MTDTPEDRNKPEEESTTPTPEGSSGETQEEATEVMDDGSPGGSPGGRFNLGRTGRRIAVAGAVAAAFFSGMILYSALDDHDSDAERASFVTPPPGAPGQPGEVPGMPGGGPGMPGGGPGGFHEGGPGWSHDGDDDYDHEGDDYDHDDQYEGDDDRGEHGDDRYEERAMPPGYQAPSGGGNQPAPMGSGQS